MAEIECLSRVRAKQDPAAAFDTPAEIVDSRLLTRGEKLATLARWRADILQEITAAGEGMRTLGISSTHARLVQEIDAAVDLLTPSANDERAAD